MQSGRFGWKRPQVWFGYVVAVVATAAMVLLRIGLEAWLAGQAPMLVLTAGVFVAALVGGLGPGLLATGLSLLAGSFLFIPPYYQFKLGVFPDQVRLAIFLLMGVMVSVLSEMLRRSQDREHAGLVALSESEERFGLIVAQVKEYAIFMLDRKGRVISWNEGAERIKGYQAEEVLGQHFSRFYTPEEIAQDKPGRELAVAAAEGQYSEEGWRVRKDGSRFWASVSITALHNKAGKLRGFAKVTRDITERKRTEEELLESERRFRGTFENAAVGISHVDAEGCWLRVNQKLCEMLGYTKEELYCKNFREITHPEDVGVDCGRYEALMRGELESYAIQKRYIRKDGSTVWAGVTRALQRDEAGCPLYSIAVIEDITARQQAQAALRESENRYRTLVEMAPDIVFGISVPDQKFTALNQTFEAITGYSPGEWLGKSFVPLLHPDDMPIAIEVYREICNGREPSSRELRLCCKGGGYRTVEVMGRPVLHEGRVVSAMGIARDITERKRNEAALQASEERFRLVSRATSDVIWDWDLGNNELVWSEAVQTTFGYRLDEALQRISWWYEQIHPEDRDRVVESIHGVIDDPAKQFWTAEYRFRHSRGHWVSVLDRGLVARDAQGRGVRMIGSMLDLSERKRAEEAIRESEDRFRQAFGHAPVGMALTDLNGKFQQVNRAYCQLVGYEEQELVHSDLGFTDLTHPDDRNANLYVMRRMLAGEIPAIFFEKRYIRKDGQIVWVRASVTARRDGEGKPFQLVAIIEDITARKQAEGELAAAKASAEQAKAAAEEASRAKDHFLAVLSHELRTPLTPVVAAAGMLERDLRVPEDVRDDARMIRRNIELEKRLIDDLLDLTRIARGKLELELREVDASAVLRQAIDICSVEMDAKQLELDADLDDCPHQVRADAARLQQVFWNLLNNAIKFTPEGGRIAVRCYTHGDGRLLTEVRDTGIGVDPGSLMRIFSAFEQQDRTVTRRYGGLGLGLAICQAIVRQHGGSILAQSEGRGKGTVFTVDLPLLKGEADVSRQSQQRPRPKSASTRGAQREALRILLVEDHADTARIMSRILRGNGHAVRTADCVASALALADSEAFDLIISDLGLPDGSGLELMQQLRQQCPALKGIAVSGFGQESDIQKSQAAGFVEHITKPVDLDRLERVITRVAG